MGCRDFLAVGMGASGDDRENPARGGSGCGHSSLCGMCSGPASTAISARRQQRGLANLAGRKCRAEFVMMSFWESREAIEGFAGQDVEKAVFYPDDDQFLIKRDLTMQHYQVAGTE